VLLANLALRKALKEKLTQVKLHWGGDPMKVTNLPEANQYLRRDYRQCWTVQNQAARSQARPRGKPRLESKANWRPKAAAGSALGILDWDSLSASSRMDRFLSVAADSAPTGKSARHGT